MSDDAIPTGAGASPVEPFFKVPRWFVQGGWLGKLTPTATAVAMIICNYQSYSTGWCLIGAPKIAALVGRTVRGVREALAELSRHGLMEVVEQGDGNASRRRITAPTGAQEFTGEATFTGEPTFTPPVNATAPHGCERVHPTGEATFTHKRQGRRPSKEKKLKETIRRVVDSVIPPGVDTEEFREAWGRWSKYLTERRKTLTPSTAALQLKKAEAAGVAGSVAAINEAIERGWQSFFPKATTGEGEYAEPNGGGALPIYNPNGFVKAPVTKEILAVAFGTEHDHPGLLDIDRRLRAQRGDLSDTPSPGLHPNLYELAAKESAERAASQSHHRKETA